MKYMGCVTDKEFNRALLEMYPNRKVNSSDQYRRKAIVSKYHDLPELQSEMNKREARRYYAS